MWNSSLCSFLGVGWTSFDSSREQKEKRKRKEEKKRKKEKRKEKKRKESEEEQKSSATEFFWKLVFCKNFLKNFGARISLIFLFSCENFFF